MASFYLHDVYTKYIVKIYLCTYIFEQDKYNSIKNVEWILTWFFKTMKSSYLVERRHQYNRAHREDGSSQN